MEFKEDFITYFGLSTSKKTTSLTLALKICRWIHRWMMKRSCDPAIKFWRRQKFGTTTTWQKGYWRQVYCGALTSLCNSQDSVSAVELKVEESGVKMKKRRKSAPEEVLWGRQDRGPSPDPAPDPVVAPPRLWKQPPLSVCHHFKWLVQAAEMLRFQSLCLPSPVYYCCSLFHYEELRVCYLVFESHWWIRSRERWLMWLDTPPFPFVRFLMTCRSLLRFRRAWEWWRCEWDAWFSALEKKRVKNGNLLLFSLCHCHLLRGVTNTKSDSFNRSFSDT